MNKEVCGRLKEKVHMYQDNIITEVEEYSSQLMCTKEQLDNCKMKVHKWLQEKHVSEQIHQRQQMCEEMERQLEIMVERWKESTNIPTLVFPSK